MQPLESATGTVRNSSDQYKDKSEVPVGLSDKKHNFGQVQSILEFVNETK